MTDTQTALMQSCQSLYHNTFVDEIRQNLYFHQSEYGHLIDTLKNIATHIKHVDNIDKTMALYLYDIPRMVFIWKERLKIDNPNHHQKLIDQLEDAWIEIDGLILEEILGS